MSGGAIMTRKSRLVLDYAKSDGQYSDGDIEDKILKIFESKNPKEKIKMELVDPSWPILYHLSLDRQNLLSWYPFISGGSLLEIGSGCGAITELFCQKLNKVTAVELTTRRARITAERCRDYNNLTIYAGNLNDIDLGEEKFDYVTLVGVLEYAGMFTDSGNPFEDFLKKASGYLKDTGTLIIAIENKFGLKYWTGIREDHTGKLFDSIEGYPESQAIMTFGIEELKNLLLSAGLNKQDFYYPYPDYKLPLEIFSDKYLPTPSHNVRPSMMPYVDHSHQREHIFNEKMVSDNIVVNKKFPFFSNSFLVFASRGK
jgi:SAM-dependent methyltransferase